MSTEKTAPDPEIRLKYIEALSKFIVPITVVLVSVIGGNWFKSYMEERQRINAQQTFLAELIARREDADTQLRKDMYQQALALSERAKHEDLETRILGIELLARNFHDVIDIRPLLRSIISDIQRAAALPDGARAALRTSVHTLARDIAFKQIVAVQRSGNTSISTDNISFFQGFGIPAIFDFELGDKSVSITLSGFDAVQDLFEYSYLIQRNGQPIASGLGVVDPFVFPMTHNIRLDNAERGALVMREFGTYSDGEDNNIDKKFYKFSFIVFPETHANLRDRPLIEDIIRSTVDASPTRQMPAQ